MYYYWGEPGPWKERETMRKRERETERRWKSLNDNHRLVCKHVLCTLLAFQYLRGLVWQKMMGLKL